MLHRLLTMTLALIVFSTMLSMPLAIDVGAQDRQGEPTYGLGGIVQVAEDHHFGHYFVAVDGVTYGLRGVTPAVEERLGVLARSFPGAQIKIWGEHQPDTDGYPIILVRDMLAPDQGTPAPNSTMTPTPWPTATPTPAPVTVVVKEKPVYLRTGPHASYPWYTVVRPGTVCTAYARNKTASWLQVACSGGGTGWLWIEAVTIRGEITPLPVIDAAPPPTATPTPTPKLPPQPQTGQWRAQYYNNARLSSAPKADRIEARGANFPLEKSFSGSPAPGIANTNWSVQYEGPFWFGGGDYMFHADTRGGVRVYLDDHLVLDDWKGGDHVLRNTFKGVGPGEHRVRVTYFTHTGSGWLKVWWKYDDGRNRDD